MKKSDIDLCLWKLVGVRHCHAIKKKLYYDLIGEKRVKKRSDYVYEKNANR